MKRLILALVLVAAALALFVTRPPARRALASFPDGTVSGALHIHTNRSDGRGTPEEIAAAAARAGLRFVVFADHGDAMRQTDPPVYRSGVLCLDGVEISTTGGHYVALDMTAAPYPLGEDPRGVVEDVRRLGGFGIAAHPDSPKPELRWRDWTVPFDGVEWINPDTSWRVHVATGWRGRLGLANGLVHYPGRESETLARLLTRTDETAARWSTLASTRKVVILSGTDAHAKLALRNAEPGDNRFSVPFPSYDASFSTFSVHVRTDAPLSGDPRRDAALVVRGIRAGHLYTAIDGIATPPSFEFTAAAANGAVIQEGDEIAAGNITTLRVHSNAPDAFTTSIWNGSSVLASSHEHDWTVPVDPAPAVYRIEIRNGDAAGSATWLLSNPIYVRAPRPLAAAETPARRAPTTSIPAADESGAGGWHVEATSAAEGSMDASWTDGRVFHIALRYAFANVPPTPTAAALVRSGRPGMLVAYDRLAFRGRADRPMRISVQLRAPAGAGQQGRRWEQSVYLDTSSQERTIYFDGLTPAVGTGPATVALDQVDALLFVVDTAHTRLGTAGRIWIDAPVLEK